MSASKQEQLINIVEQYYLQNGRTPVESKTIAGWAIERDLWELPPNYTLNKCREEIASAMRQEKCSTPSGAQMRCYGVLETCEMDDKGREVQRKLWVDLREATYEQAVLVFRSRLRKVREVTESYIQDVKAYNENYLKPGESPIQLGLDYDDELGNASVA